MDHRLEKILSQLDDNIRNEMIVTPLVGGITNQTYRIDLKEETFVLRIFGENTHLLGINRHYEYICTYIVAKIGIGAEIESWISGEDFLLTKFIKGTPITKELVKDYKTVKRIITSVKKCHDASAFPNYYSAFEGIRFYYNQGKKYGTIFPESIPQVFNIMSQIESAIGSSVNLKSCHNDLLAGNFIDDGKIIRIIDWEYGAMNDPFFDLGFVAVDLGLDDPQCEFILECYFGEVKKKDIAHLKLMKLVSDLREAISSLMLSTISNLNVDYVSYFSEHYERFLSNATKPNFSELLEQISE